MCTLTYTIIYMHLEGNLDLVKTSNHGNSLKFHFDATAILLKTTYSYGNKKKTLYSSNNY